MGEDESQVNFHIKAAEYTDSMVNKTANKEVGIKEILEKGIERNGKGNDLFQKNERLVWKNKRIKRELNEKIQRIDELETKNRQLKEILEEIEDEKNQVLKTNHELTKTLQSAINEYLIITVKDIQTQFKKKWNIPDSDRLKLLKYSKFLIKTVQTNEKLKTLFDDRINSCKDYVQSISACNLEVPFLNTLQFLCDILLHQQPQLHESTQTENAPVKIDFLKMSPIKCEHEDFFTEADVFFENSQEGLTLSGANLHNDRLARLHQQISETMHTNKLLLTNPLKGDHYRSRSEFFEVKNVIKGGL